jgi:hypothetical protein
MVTSVPSSKCWDSTVLKLGHDRFLPYPFQLIIYLSPLHSKLHNMSCWKVYLNYKEINRFPRSWAQDVNRFALSHLVLVSSWLEQAAGDFNVDLMWLALLLNTITKQVRKCTHSVTFPPFCIATREKLVQMWPDTKFKSGTSRKLKIIALWDEEPTFQRCVLQPSSRRRWPDNGGSTHPWNVGLLQRDYNAQHSRRL